MKERLHSYGHSGNQIACHEQNAVCPKNVSRETFYTRSDEFTCIPEPHGHPSPYRGRNAPAHRLGCTQMNRNDYKKSRPLGSAVSYKS